jgi:hypothetical protein
MKKGNLSKSSIISLISSGLRLSVTLIIALVVISSPVVMFVNPTHVLAYPSVTDTSNDHVTMPMSEDSSRSMSSLASPTIQAPLQIPRTLQSNDLVNSLAFYEVTFITSTTGAIDKIQMDFPGGTIVAAAGLIERVGIGGGTLLKSGSSITYDLTTPVSIPAGTFIRLEMFGIKNPLNPSTTFTAMITTQDSGGVPIDGPSQTNVYTIKKIVSSDLADGAVTKTKPAESFMKKVLVLDNAAGNLVGWDPDGVVAVFEIAEPLAAAGSTSSAIINIDSTVVADPVCSASQVFNGQIEIFCTSPPADGSTLDYTVTNVSPVHLVQ